MKNKGLIGVSICSVVVTLLVYSRLPGEVAIHFNMVGEADGFGPKWLVLVLGGLPLITIGLFQMLPNLDPKKEAYQKFEKPYQRILLAVTVMLVSVHWMILLVALGYDINIAVLTQLFISLLIIVMGNYLGQIKPNYLVGIKTPWTLASDRVWVKTHRQGAKFFVLSGLIGLLGMFTSSSVQIFWLIGPLVVTIVGLVVYSYYLFKQE